MQGHRISLFLLILATCCGTSFARLGDSPQALLQRYGAPLSSDTVGPFARSVFQKQAFQITVFYQNGVSVLETFARRGLDQATARQVVALVAGPTFFARPDQCHEDQLRKDSGITCKDEVFWTWTTPPAQPMSAAFDPAECTLTFFSSPAIYSGVHQALMDAPL